MTVIVGQARSDEELLAGLADGDEVAAVEFVQRFDRRVFGLAVGIVGNAASADEVVQQTFERAWLRAASFDPRRGSVATWLLTIARNLSIDELRRKRPEAVDPSLLEGGDPATSDAPAEAAVRGSEVAEVQAALRRLPDEQRRAVLLAALHGHTAGEIAALEGIPLGTAKTRIRSGLRRVRAALVVAAVVILAALGAVALRQSLNGGAGSPVIRTAELANAEGAVNGAVVVVDDGSWMALRLDSGRSGADYTCELVLDDGTVVSAGRWTAGEGGSGWAGPLPVEAERVAEVRIVGTGGVVRASASLD